MKKNYLIFFLLVPFFCFSQDIKRVEVDGKIVVKEGDVEGITIYNTSSEQGTISDLNGSFKIFVAANERVEISSLQFQKFTVVVDLGVISSKKLTIYLVEQVNKLPEVIVSPYDLSGNIIVDVNRVKTTNLPFQEGEFDIDKVPVDLTADYKSGVNNPFVTGAGDLGADIKNGLLKPLLKAIFKKKKPKNEDAFLNKPQDDILDLRLMYTNKEFSGLLGIPEDQVNDFIMFMEKDGLDYSLLKQGRELEFVDFLVLESKSFLGSKIDKN